MTPGRSPLIMSLPRFQAEVAEPADALDSKSSVSNDVWVRVPPSALRQIADLQGFTMTLSDCFIQRFSFHKHPHGFFVRILGSCGISTDDSSKARQVGQRLESEIDSRSGCDSDSSIVGGLAFPQKASNQNRNVKSLHCRR